MADRREIWCENCGSFQPLDDEGGPHSDALNPYPWHDLVCATCHFVIASIRYVPDHAKAAAPPDEGGTARRG